MEAFGALATMIVGLVVTGVAMFVLLRMVRGTLGRVAQGQAEVQRLLQYGQQATGRVIAIGSGGMTKTMGVQRGIEVCVDLEVWVAGRPPYRTQAKQMVRELSIASLQPGTQVALRVDPSDPGKVIVADVAMAPAHGLAGYGYFG